MSVVCHLYGTCTYSCHTHVVRMSLKRACILSICTRMPFVCHWYVLACHPYVTRMYVYVICMSLICTCMSSICHSYVIRMSLVCTHMSSVCYSYVLACHLYVTCMSYVIVCSCMSLYVNRMWFYHEPNSDGKSKETKYKTYLNIFVFKFIIYLNLNLYNLFKYI